jgi:hypothetical protein
MLFTRNRQLYNNNLPPRKPERVTPITRASFWDLSLVITLFNIRLNVDYRPLEQQYLEVITKSLTAIIPKGLNVARLTAVPVAAYVPPPIEKPSPPLTFNVTGPSAASPLGRRLLQIPATNVTDRVGVLLPMQLLLLAGAPGDVINVTAAEQLETHILADGGTAIWSGMQVAGSNDAAKTFVVPSRVSVSVSGIVPKFNVLPDPTTTTQMAGDVSTASSNGGNASISRGASRQKGRGLSAWKVVVIAGAATAALLAALLAAICCCRCGCCGLTRRTQGKSSTEAGVLGSTPQRSTALDASIVRYASSGPAEVLVSPYARSHGANTIDTGGASSKDHAWIAGLTSTYSTSGSTGTAAAAAAAATLSRGNLSRDLLSTADYTIHSQTKLLPSVTRHTKAAELATTSLVCDVGVLAMQQPLRSKAVASAMAVVLCELDELAKTGNYVVGGDYRLVLRHSALSLTPHSVRVCATAPDGSAVEVHLGITPALFKRENLLYHKQVCCTGSFTCQCCWMGEHLCKAASAKLS